MVYFILNYHGHIRILPHNTIYQNEIKKHFPSLPFSVGPTSWNYRNITHRLPNLTCCPPTQDMSTSCCACWCAGAYCIVPVWDYIHNWFGPRWPDSPWSLIGWKMRPRTTPNIKNTPKQEIWSMVCVRAFASQGVGWLINRFRAGAAVLMTTRNYYSLQTIHCWCVRCIMQCVHTRVG